MSTRRVAIVTDSTASIPEAEAKEWGISVIQLELKVGDEYNDERRVPHPLVADALRLETPVETGPPPQPAFFWNYMDAATAGAEAIVSVHISGALSQTCEAARAASHDIDIPVHVVDSRLCGLGLGYPVLMAAEAAASGASAQGVLHALDRRLRNTTQLVYVDTLEYLKRSGRITRAQAALGAALSMKPVLIMRDGSIEQLTKGMGPERAFKRAINAALERAGGGPVDVGVEHFQSAERAERVLDQLRTELPQVRRITLEETSTIIGAHAGPGAMGITVSPV